MLYENNILNHIERLQIQYLTYSYLYYFKNETLVTDSYYDNLCSWLYNHMKKNNDIAKTKYYNLCKGLDMSGSGFYIKEEDYPPYIKWVAFKLLLQRDLKCEVTIKELINSSACFTGHRPQSLGSFDPKSKDNKKMIWAIHDIIVDHIVNKNVSIFISGMALGIDIWSAKTVLYLKEKYPHIKLICAIPCKEQFKKWSKADKEEWLKVVKQADLTYYVSTENYTAWCMDVRNKWMVNNAKYVIAVFDGTKGGTQNCINDAIKANKIITTLHPKTLEVT